MRLLPKKLSLNVPGARRVAASLTGLVSGAALLASLIAPASAQTPPEPQKYEPKYPGLTAPATLAQEILPRDYQSQLDPFPYGHGNAQNRGWSPDPYWSILNGNVPWGIPTTPGAFPTLFPVLSRVPNAGVNPQFLELDGWGFPRGASVFGAFLTRASVTVPTGNGQPAPAFGGPAFATNWAAVQNGQPSTITSGAGQYYRSPAQVRVNIPAQNVAPAQRFAYDLRAIAYTGADNSQERFQIRVSLPSPNPNATTGNPEGRVTDARYLVYYYIRINGNYLARRKVYTVSQAGGGEETLTNTNGNPAYFPLFIRQGAAQFGTTLPNGPLPVQPDLGVAFQGVILDNTTGNAGQDLYVVADTLQLVPTIDGVNATPTLTAKTGGRRAASADPTNQTNTNFAPGEQPFQPVVGANYNSDQSGTNIGAFVNSTVNERYNNSSDFVNDPFDPRYDPTSPQFDPLRPYESWNPSVLFRGPESLIDPRFQDPANALTAFPIPVTQPLEGRPVGPGTTNRPQVPVRDPITGQTFPIGPGGTLLTRPASSIDANNHNIFRRNRRAAYNPNPTNAATYNPAVPYYSQTQVIIARTEYVLDPEDGVPDNDKDGTLTLQVGAVFGLDWQTGTPIWRFPDRSYAESRTPNAFRANYRNPFVPANVNATQSETDDVSQAARNPLNPNQPQYLVPGIRVIDKNLDGIIADDEVYIVGQGGNANGGLFASVSYSPRVKVRGNVRLPLYRTVTDATTGRTFSLIRHADDGLAYNTGAHAETQTLQPGRYATRPNSPEPFAPVEVGVAYVAASNGVVYAIDPYGNNDNDYIPYGPNSVSPVVNPNYRTFGDYRPGTTNVLWTFSAINSRQGDTDRNGTIDRASESAEAYNLRLKGEIPGTASFAQSAPVLAFQRDSGDFNLTTADPVTGIPTRTNPFNWRAEEQRLFVGNSNGVLYAMDSAADAGRQFNSTGAATGVQNLPFRKESYRPVIGFVPPDPNLPSGYVLGAQGLKWWFQSFTGGINGSPAVSQLRQDAGQLGTALPTLRGMDDARKGRKGVFFTSLEGRVYGLDWHGPVTKITRHIPLSIASGTGDADAATGSQPYDDPSLVGVNTFASVPSGALAGYPNAPATLAEALNDGWYFHNVRPATARAQADRKEGTVRPRWTYPNLYQDINLADNTRNQVADNAVGNGLTNPAGETIAGIALATGSTSIGQITTPPVLIDFPFQTTTGQTRYRSYLSFQAPDFTTDPSPTQSRLYLLDQVGDRANFLTNPRLRGTGAARRVVSHPRDRWSPGVVLAESAPAWSYRTVYDRLTPGGTTTSDIEMARRNSPIVVTGPVNRIANNSPLVDTQVLNGVDRNAVPGRRVLPTVYIGGIGRVYAIDIDLETGLLMRWRPGSPTSNTAQIASLVGTGAFTPLPDIPGTTTDQDFAPGAESTANRLNPLDYSFTDADRAGLSLSQVFVRVTPFEGLVAQVTHITIAGGVQNRSATQPLNGQATPTLPTIPAFPSQDVPVLGLPYLSLLQGVVATGNVSTTVPNYDFGDLYTATAADAPQRGITRRVNQDINDPLPTTEGYVSSIPGTVNTNAAVRIPNTAYQFPLLFVTDIEGYLHAISSNIEGEDYDSDVNQQHPVGWAVLGFSDQVAEPISTRHTLQFTQQGPGGLSGVAVMSNAYLPALDPAFTNPDREAATPTDPYRFYPYGEPNTVSPTPYRVSGALTSPPTAVEPLANNDDPRPAFRPRSFSAGRAAVLDANGNVVSPAVLADWHTGQTGFPLDLNGLFFDKRFAGRYGFTPTIAATAESVTFDPLTIISNLLTDPITGQPLIEPLQANPQHPNGDYRIRMRLPGYDFVGGNLLEFGTGDPTGRRDTQGNLFSDLVPGPLGPQNPNNQVPDGTRVDRGPTGTGSATGNLSATNDDINPAAQNVAWLYAGGQNGLVYAFTPSLPGQTSGFGAGTPIFTGTNDRTNGDAPRVAIVNQNFYDTVIRPAIQNGTPLPADFATQVLANSVARNGGKNFYEWGESIYIVVYDLSARTTPTSASDFFVSPDRRITLDFIAENVNTTSGRAVVTQARGQASGTLLSYQEAGNPQPLGIAVYEYRLTGNPSSSLPQTPGANIRVSASVDSGRIPGRRVGSALAVSDPTGLGTTADNYFSIANPLAVQGVLVDTRDGAPLIARGAKDTHNGVGPFAAAAPDTGGAPKTRVAGQVDGIAAVDTEDPDRTLAEYAQALTNGNEIARRFLRRFDGTGAAARPNPRYNNLLTDANRVQEPRYYMPVMSSAGYISHGSSGSTDTGPLQQNLRILNRSLLSALGSVRVESLSSGLFRSWPGQVPNAVGDLREPFSGTLLQDNNNPRFTPQGMDIFGRINPLPWEAPGTDVRPWAADSPVNNNPDYSDIIANNRTLRVAGPGGDLTAGNGNLTADVGGRVNNTVGSGDDITVPLVPILAVSATVNVPKYQAANLVATHSLTSTFVAPSSTDSTTPGLTTVGESNEGPVQLPRATGTGIPRALQFLNTTNQGITPFGYTMGLRVYAGNPGLTTSGSRSAVVNLQNGNTGLGAQASTRVTTAFATGAYRDFELDFGVPVDMRLETTGRGTDVIDLGIVGHSFGIDNGLLGYGVPDLTAPGFLPTPLAQALNNPYDNFFKAFTVRNEGNVNLYNLRASQRSQVVLNNGDLGQRLFGMQSQNIDSRFAIGAVGADVSLTNRQLPQVVTSLDRRFDLTWNQYLAARPELNTPINANGDTLYSLYYGGFAGKHTLHKARTGAQSGSVLGVPDLPGSQRLLPPGIPDSQFVSDPRVGIAVPIGTPSAVYSTPEVRSGDSRSNRAILGQSLVIFEDHDAGPNNLYQSVPVWDTATNRVSPAGPLYAGQNVQHPGGSAIAGYEGDPFADLYSLWRVRGITRGLNGNTPLYQPYTERGLPLRVTVSESPLTGDVPDRSLADRNAGTNPSISTGRLPGIDPFPLVDRNPLLAANGNVLSNILRPAQALAPAAYRDDLGNINVYFSRNFLDDVSKDFAKPGLPYRLFHSRLNWNQTLGAFQPVQSGNPIAGINPNVQADYNSGASWFSKPALLGAARPNDANTAPFVLDTRTFVSGGGASLFWLNSAPIGAGQTYSQIVAQHLDATGNPTGAIEPFLNNYDPSVQRFAPRAAFARFGTSGNNQVNANQTFVFYYGGAGGRYSLYYSARPADATGFPTGGIPDATARGQNREVQLPLPASLSAASDPMPVYRFLQVPVFDNQGAYQGVRPSWVVDVYYTGLSRTTQVPSIYLNRYEIVGQGNRFRLQPQTLPRIRFEALAASAREPVYTGRHIDWQRNLGRRRDLPIVRIGASATDAVPVGMTPAEFTNWQGSGFAPDAPSVVAAARRQQDRWQFDNATGLLYQGFTRTVNGTVTQNVVYVDTAAGTVRFRGNGIPRRAENVLADYQPSAYRITPDGQTNQAAFAFMDNSPIAETLDTPNQPNRNNIVRRTKPLAVPFTGIGRQWVIWQKGANAERGGALVHSVRRVGVDLKSLSTLGRRLAQNDSILLSQPNNDGNQVPLVQAVNVFTLDANGTRQNVTLPAEFAYEVDPVKGRIYLEPQYEGFFVEVQYSPASAGSTGAPVIADSALTQVDELAETTTQPREVLIPLRRVVNEIQPYAFLDRFNALDGINRPSTIPQVRAVNPSNNRTEIADPTLQPGRVWLFWSSPRGRQGTATQNGRDLFPGGYDLFWQTLAPEFEPYLPVP